MPELPEVETVRRGLQPSMEGAVIVTAQVNRPDLRWPFPERMAERLTGARVNQLRRRSKYILADLDTGETLLIHLGMSGRMTVSGDPLGQFVHQHPQAEKHDHVVFDMDNGARVTFNDPRRFGAMDLLETSTAEQHKLLSVLGPEPLGNDFHEDHLTAAFKGRNTPVKSALLDQGIIAGLGNQDFQTVASAVANRATEPDALIDALAGFTDRNDFAGAAANLMSAQAAARVQASEIAALDYFATSARIDPAAPLLYWHAGRYAVSQNDIETAWVLFDIARALPSITSDTPQREAAALEERLRNISPRFFAAAQ